MRKLSIILLFILFCFTNIFCSDRNNMIVFIKSERLMDKSKELFIENLHSKMLEKKLYPEYINVLPYFNTKFRINYNPYNYFNLSTDNIFEMLKALNYDYVLIADIDKLHFIEDKTLVSGDINFTLYRVSDRKSLTTYHVYYYGSYTINNYLDFLNGLDGFYKRFNEKILTNSFFYPKVSDIIDNGIIFENNYNELITSGMIFCSQNFLSINTNAVKIITSDSYSFAGRVLFGSVKKGENLLYLNPKRFIVTIGVMAPYSLKKISLINPVLGIEYTINYYLSMNLDAFANYDYAGLRYSINAKTDYDPYFIGVSMEIPICFYKNKTHFAVGAGIFTGFRITYDLNLSFKIENDFYSIFDGLLVPKPLLSFRLNYTI